MRVSFLAILLSAMLLSCKKEKKDTQCTQNCASYTVSGKVYDGITNTGFANTPVNLQWSYTRYCIVCPGSKNIYSGNADANGNFNFTITIDTSLFRDYSLELKTPVINTHFELFPRVIPRDDLAQNRSINVAYYPKADLQLRLHRVQTDVMQHLNVLHIWKATATGEFITQYDYFGTTPNITGDTVLNIKTVAGLYTKIILDKVYPNGTRAEITDSVVCNRNSVTVVNMNF